METTEEGSPRVLPAADVKYVNDPMKSISDAAPAAGPHDGMGGEREEGGDMSTGISVDTEYYPQPEGDTPRGPSIQHVCFSYLALHACCGAVLRR